MKVKWLGKTHSKVRSGYIGEELVAEIFTIDTHKHKPRNGSIYIVKVGSKTLNGPFRNVDDAKNAVTTELSNSDNLN